MTFLRSDPALITLFLVDKYYLVPLSAKIL